MTSSSNFYSTFRYSIDLGRITQATFTECSGLQAEVEVLEWPEGGRNDYVHRLPGRVKPYGNLVLKRGIASDELYQWYYDVSIGTIARQDISIILHGYDSEQKVRWDVSGALPIKWVGPDFKAAASEVAFETIELAHNGFKRVKVQ